MDVYKTMATHLETARLTLRPWTDADAGDLRELFGERGTGMPDMAEAKRDVEVLRERTESSGIALLPVQRRAEGDFIGYCGLVIGRSTLEEPEIAYELFQRAHGHGYATEAADAVVRAAAATGRTRLWSTVATWNTPSLRVLDKLGFTRDHVSTEPNGEVAWLTRTLP